MIDQRTRLIINDSVVAKLNNYRQGVKSPENGGVLLGKIKTDFTEYIITDISEPCEEDKQGRHFFVRNKDNAQSIINQFWENSGGEIMYLGEWHTHPELYPSPSLVDSNLIKKCSIEIKPLPMYIFLVIVGESGSLYVGYKNVCKRKATLKKLNEV
ncbi:Mov34/MPN/PAD-1 family protein [Clostridium guangxiense]|uniref:Mov34/MPN/PAD-1 family protein n=1 Tax=Clostridium guangxiense TaxID=1662055 RepID=UPI001E5D93A8|nr:Mov34/MPN/PAD-1 family protein [Clostridium guangxiense]MCD2348880.1 Mov34/MPN/PAD-1 family protein [Clostridium guangxiense]